MKAKVSIDKKTKKIVKNWPVEYNRVRFYGLLKGFTPKEFTKDRAG